MKFALALGMILGAIAFSGHVATAADAILINFSSAHCAPCRAMEPTLSQLELSGVPVRRVDVAAEPDLARRYGIRTTPTFVVVSGGKEVTRLVGTHSLAQLQAAIAIDPSGPLIPTGAKVDSSAGLADFSAPQTRLAPVRAFGPGHQTYASSAAAPAAMPPVAAMPPAAAMSLAGMPANAGMSATAARPATGAAAHSEPMPSASLADAIQRAEAATVRLRVHDGTGYGTGTGTIIDTHGDEALVLTCGHLFRETQGKGKIEVDLFIGGEIRTVPGQVVDYDAEDRDIALVAIEPGFPVQSVQVLSPTDRVRTGQTAFSFGCDRGADPSRRDTRITGIDKYNQHLGVSNLEIAGAPIDGRSGGGLFDDRGRLIGVCNAADYQDDVGIYAGPGTIVWQLDRVNLARLYQTPAPANPIVANPSAAAPPADRIASLPSGPGLPSGSGVIRPVSSLPPSAAQPSSLAPPRQSPTGDQEVIVIIRNRNQPSEPPRVMTLTNPGADLMQMIEHHAR